MEMKNGLFKTEVFELKKVKFPRELQKKMIFQAEIGGEMGKN